MPAIRHGTMLPSLQRKEIGTSELDPFRQLNTWPVVSPVNASRRPSRDAAHHSGSGRMLVLTPRGTFTSYSLPAFLALSVAGHSRRLAVGRPLPGTSPISGTFSGPLGMPTGDLVQFLHCAR